MMNFSAIAGWALTYQHATSNSATLGGDYNSMLILDSTSINGLSTPPSQDKPMSLLTLLILDSISIDGSSTPPLQDELTNSPTLPVTATTQKCKNTDTDPDNTTTHGDE